MGRRTYALCSCISDIRRLKKGQYIRIWANPFHDALTLGLTGTVLNGTGLAKSALFPTRESIFALDVSRS